jgi:hypothetical protein
MQALSVSIIFGATLFQAFAACDLPRFGGAHLFGGANDSTFVAMGDFNQDGFPDVVLGGKWMDAANKPQSGISISLNNGDGTFAPPVYSIQAAPAAAVVADFNGDGKPDLALASNNGILVMLGNGDGTFKTAIRIATGANSMAVGDFNGDGKLDLAVNSSLAILLGKGDGTFQNPIIRAGSGTAFIAYGPIAVGDFNGDGNLDVVTGTPKGSILLFAGDGKGGLGAPVTANTGSPNNPAQLGVADLNSDHKLDVVTLDFAANTISVLLGNGSGGFQPAKTFPAGGVGNSSFSLVVADLNGDSIPDVAVATFASITASGSTISVFPGNGDGTFQPVVQYNPGPFMTALVPGDFNSDGITDLLFTSADGVLPAQIGVIFGSANGTFQSPVSYPVGSMPGPPVLADLNGDGALDLVIAAAGTGGNLSVLLGNGDGTFQPAVTILGAAGASYVAVGDFNGDGKPDLVTSFVNLSNFSTNLVVFLGNGDGTFQAPRATSVFNAAQVVVGDFNKDGKLDVSAAGQIMLGNGDGTFQATTTFVSTLELAVDLNGDGKLDMVGIGSRSVLVQLGNGDGTFQRAVQYATGTGSSVVVGDVNGDGKPDLVAVGDTFIRGAANQVLSGNIAVLLGNGDGTFQPAVKYPVAAGLLSVILGDFNGDGLVDVAVTSGLKGTNNPATGVTILLGNGDGTFRSAATYAAPNGPLAAGDLNGDGQQDLVIADDYAGMAQVLLNTYVPGISGSACAPVTPAGK